MRNGRSLLSICCAILLFLVLSFPRAYGEKIFRWTDEAGRPYYSNVSPPAGIKSFSTDTMPGPVSKWSSPVRVPADTGAAKKIPVAADRAYPDLSAAFLRQRITDRRRSIGHIESLLRKHPNDSDLRSSLLKKRQYLFEDLTQLKNVQP